MWLQIGYYFTEKLIFQVQNFKSNSEAIPEVVTFKAFEFPALADVLEEWPMIVDLQRPEDAIAVQKKAIRYYKKAANYFETQAKQDGSVKESAQAQHVKIILEMSRLHKVMSWLQPQTDDFP